MTTPPAQRAPKSNLLVPIILGIVLVPLSQSAVAYLGGRGGSVMGWLVGTPICYFLIGGLGAFATVSGLLPAQARTRGAWVGFIAGISGTCSAGLIVAGFVVWSIVVPQQHTSLLHPPTSIMPRFLYIASGPSYNLPLIVFVILLLPFFLGVNLLGIGLAPLGGLLGGYLRARISPHDAALLAQTGEREVARSRRGILAITIIAILLAIIVTAAGFLYIAGAFPAITG